MYGRRSFAPEGRWERESGYSSRGRHSRLKLLGGEATGFGSYDSAIRTEAKSPKPSARPVMCPCRHISAGWTKSQIESAIRRYLQSVQPQLLHQRLAFISLLRSFQNWASGESR